MVSSRNVILLYHLNRALIADERFWLFDATAMLFNQIMVDVIKFPFDAIGIYHPELRLVRIAAIHVELLTYLQALLLDAPQMLFDDGTGRNLNSQMIHRGRSLNGLSPCRRNNEIQGCEGHQ